MIIRRIIGLYRRIATVSILNLDYAFSEDSGERIERSRLRLDSRPLTRSDPGQVATDSNGLISYQPQGGDAL